MSVGRAERPRFVHATDICTSAGAIKVAIGNYTLSQGETIPITQPPGQSSVALDNDMRKIPVRHFRPRTAIGMP